MESEEEDWNELLEGSEKTLVCRACRKVNEKKKNVVLWNLQFNNLHCDKTKMTLFHLVWQRLPLDLLELDEMDICMYRNVYNFAQSGSRYRLMSQRGFFQVRHVTSLPNRARSYCLCARCLPNCRDTFGWRSLSQFLNSSVIVSRSGIWGYQVMPLPNTKNIMGRLETIIIVILKQLDLPLLLSLEMKVFFS